MLGFRGLGYMGLNSALMTGIGYSVMSYHHYTKEPHEVVIIVQASVVFALAVQYLWGTWTHIGLKFQEHFSGLGVQGYRVWGFRSGLNRERG